MTSTAVTTFAFNTAAICVVDLDGSPWFVANDVVKHLGYRMASDATRALAIDGAPLVLDTDLGKSLGMARPANIRRTIEANREELEGYGPCTSRVHAHPTVPGRFTTAYYLNEEQALLICMFSGAPLAKAIRREVIAVYQAWRKGKLQPAAPAMPAIPQDFASALRLAADEHEKRVALEVTLKVTQEDLAEKTDIAA